MAMTALERQRCTAQLMRDNESPIGAITKAELRAAIDATDDWIDANATSFNQALPENVRTQLTAVQKNWLFSYVLAMRIGRLRIEGD